MPAHKPSELMDLLHDLPAGDIPDEIRAELIARLADCWSEFSGSQESKMQAYKLRRAECWVWKPPLLCFVIARHGATKLDSSREHMQHWEVNLEEKTAFQETSGFRQVHPTAHKLTQADMISIARRVCDAIQAGSGSDRKSDVHLNWIDETEFRIKLSSLIPCDGFRQTVEGRRRRMKVILQREIEDIGWVLVERSGPWFRFRKAATAS